MSWDASEGTPYPLGVTWVAEADAYNFAIYSKHATSVRLLAFGADVERACYERVLDPLVNKSARIWHCRVPAAALRDARYYAYAVDGPAPAGPFELHAFHPEKLLLDPYARHIFIPPRFDRAAATGAAPDLGRAPLGVLAPPAPYTWRAAAPRHEADAVIYELHVRGFTRDPSSGVSEAARGTFAGVIEKIPYLQELGVTIVELMPICQLDPQSGDYWGYMPMSWFAPHAGYATADPFRELCELIDALHAAGIEVVVDAVYNHTAEGGAGGPIYSFKGLDNSTYYLMKDGAYADYSGCGNSVNANNRYVRSMILDSMRYWVRELHVDGFRFDLASVFTRGPDGSLAFDDPPIFGDIAADPSFARVRLIAEPWDAAGAYELGRAFPGMTWLQWNGRYREDLHRFVCGEAGGGVGVLMQRLYGSDDLFPDDVMHAYHAYQSVNYVTCHDGPTLNDLVASERQAKNLVALLLLSNGTPMLRAGDEFLQTQHGATNPWDVDDATTWLDWSQLERHRAFFGFVKQLIAFRKQHPSLARSRFWRDDVHWFGPRGVVDLRSRELALCLDGASQGDADLYIMVNGGDADIAFVVQDVNERPWRLAIDTAGQTDPAAPVPLPHDSYVVRAESVVVLVR